MTNEADRIAPLREFVQAMTQLVDRTDDEAALLAGTRPLLAKLIADEPIHDHTVWGLVGMLRGAERCRRYARAADGEVRRHVLDAATGTAKDFVSGYSSASVPNLWDRSATVRASLA